MKWFDIIKNKIDYNRFNEVLFKVYKEMVDDFLKEINVKKITYSENVDSENRGPELREAYKNYGKKGEYYGRFLEDKDLTRFELDIGQKSTHSYTKLKLQITCRDAKIVGNNFSVDLEIKSKKPLASVSDVDIGFITITWPHVDVKEYHENPAKQIKLLESYTKQIGIEITLEHNQDTLFLEELMGYERNGVEIYTDLKRYTRNLYKRAYRNVFHMLFKEANKNV